MQAKFNKAGYISEEINSWVDSKVKVKGLTDYLWDYIESAIEEKLEINQIKLINALHLKK